MSRFVIIGSNGQLGHDLLRAAREQGRDATGLNHADIEITDAQSVQTILGRLKPRVVINTAAAHSAKQDTSADHIAFYDVNAIGVWHLARWCWQNDAVFVHYGTDYVFGAERNRAQPYTETDAPCPTNLYGTSKLAGEKMVSAFCPQHYILRIASVYGETGSRAKNNSNFVLMTLGKIRAGENMKVVDDQLMSPTWTRAAALKTFELLDARAPFGLYHLAGRGMCSWYEFACEIVKIAGGKILIEPTKTPEDKPGDIFLRPRFTALDNANLRRAGLKDLPEWQESLGMFLRNFSA
jgi:dTDP-4-dehydrorhamnose reductase